MTDKIIRLQKMISDCGITSRRKAEQLIINKCVRVNGKTAQIGDKVNPYKDKVYVNDQKVIYAAKPKKRYIMLYKPRGYVTTTKDELGRKCVSELISDIPERLYPVGRLDKDSEGLLLLTNDGDFANAVTHPKGEINKVYRVTVRPSITEEQINSMSNGMVIDGYQTAPAQVRVLQKEEGRVVLEITISEGRNRQIRKMAEQLELEVARLKRNSIGPVKLGMLKSGQWRNLTAEEVKKLKV